MFILNCAILLVVITLVAADLPPEISKCKAGDTKCIAETINSVLRNYPNGNPAFGLQSVSDIVLHDLVVSKASGNSPVQLDFKFKKLHLRGFETSIINRVVGFENDLSKSKFEVYGVLPTLHITGQYVMKGKVLLLPIEGEGNADITLRDAKFTIKLRLKEDIRDGKHFGKVSKIYNTFEPEGFHVKIDNLFNGNKELSDSLNLVINDNWKDVWSELKDGINHAGAIVLRNLLTSVSNVLPYDEFYQSD